MIQPLFDRGALRMRQGRAGVAPVTFLLDRVVDDMADRLGAILRSFDAAADIGTPGGRAAQAMATQTASWQAVPIPDDEALTLSPASLDLAVSALAFQTVNDLPGLLAQIRRVLKPDGFVIAALAGGETLTELRQSFAIAESEVDGGISPRVAPMADLREIGALMQRADFALPVCDVDRVIVRYPDALALMADLRGMAATNVLVERRRTPLRRTTLLRMAQVYSERFADADGRIRATFDLVWLTGWAPHPSQPKPLKPGSATASLADAVNKSRR